MAGQNAVPSNWCTADQCPSAICNGPHVTHVCEKDGFLVTARWDNTAPCPGCGLPLNGEEGF